MSTHGPHQRPREGEVELPAQITVSRDFLKRVDQLDAAVAGLRQDRERLAREIAALRKRLEVSEEQSSASITALAVRIEALLQAELGSLAERLTELVVPSGLVGQSPTHRASGAQ
jgi:predicted  nucleic acid-binding Zn-ribbon protein